MNVSKTCLCYYLIILNVITFVLMGLDKRRAIHKKGRISEKTLLFFGFVGGSLGGLFAMLLFHHKTRKKKFYYLFTLFTLFYLMLWIFL